MTEEQWELVEPMLPPPKRRRDNRGRPWASNRGCFEGTDRGPYWNWGLWTSFRNRGGYSLIRGVAMMVLNWTPIELIRKCSYRALNLVFLPHKPVGSTRYGETAIQVLKLLLS